jgi:hypothetical protein
MGGYVSVHASRLQRAFTHTGSVGRKGWGVHVKTEKVTLNSTRNRSTVVTVSLHTGGGKLLQERRVISCVLLGEALFYLVYISTLDAGAAASFNAAPNEKRVANGRAGHAIRLPQCSSPTEILFSVNLEKANHV